MSQCLAGQVDPDLEDAGAFMGAGRNAENHPIKYFCSPFYQVSMAIMNGVKGTGVKNSSHLG